MAEILSVNIDVDSDEENKPKKMNQAPDTDSVSSDSDGEVPVVKKKRATRTVRNRGAALTNVGEKVPELKPQGSSIYSNVVKQTWQSMKFGKLKEKLDVNQNSDVEDESPLLGKKKETPTKKKGRWKNPDAEEQQCCESLLLLSSDEDERQAEPDDVQVTGEETNNSFVREPTPPPESPQKLNQIRGKHKKPKQSKGMKKAFKNLEMLKKVGSLLPDESDVSIVYEEPPDTPEKKTMMIKIRSRSGIQRFEMKLDDGFLTIMKEMAQHEAVSLDRAVMFLNDVTVQPYDTPESLKLHIADIIEFHIKKPGEVSKEEESLEEDLYNDPNVVHLRVQGKDSKSRLVISINKTDPLNRLMLEYASKQNLSFQKLSFKFDGEEVSRSDTPDDLDMETDDCIDVIGC